MRKQELLTKYKHQLILKNFSDDTLELKTNYFKSFRVL